MGNKLVFNVKEKSLTDFFRQHTNLIVKEDRYDSSPYHLMRDEILVRKGSIKEKTVVFVLEDQAQRSGSKLENIYTYEVNAYDDINDKMVLKQFKIKQQPKQDWASAG